ncbi:MAG: hypothetical protein LIO85_05760 [Rikenellaceae bacterium]|nr:hypothetical protein [Rikenellaceae bacterium]
MMGYSEVNFEGKWAITEVRVYDPEAGWVEPKEEYGISFWEFMPISTVIMFTGESAHGGCITEVRHDGSSSTTGYGYHPAERLFYIDRSGFRTEGLLDEGPRERYRVEPLSDGRYRFYSLRNCGKEPLVRIEIVRYGDNHDIRHT